MKQEKKHLINIFLYINITFFIVLLFYLHHKTPFMMDDIWYSTNLATDEPLRNLADVFEGQLWHFLHWGGRNITHGILQLTLMAGDTFANIINVICTLLLSFMICLVAGYKKPLWFLFSLSLIFACNPNIKMSMCWQSGCANYVYSTVWILLFLWCYLRETDREEVKPLRGICLWIIPLGLITGWSNENMGPASFCISVCIILYLYIFLKRKVPVWMYLGSVFSLIGSLLVILAPGNFERSANLPDVGLIASLSERFMNMLRAGADFLYPSLFILAAVLLIFIGLFHKKLKAFQWFLLAHTILSYCAMLLSPHYPDRATFGTMCTCIVLAISMLGSLYEEKLISHKRLLTVTGIIYIYAVVHVLSVLITL